MHSPANPAAQPASAHECARRIAEAFAQYNGAFRAITRRAPARFEAGDWKASQHDRVERIELYDRFVERTVAEVRALLGAAALDRALWRQIRAAFALEIASLPDAAFPKTYFSSVSRRLFGTIGVAPDIEFIAADLESPLSTASAILTHAYAIHGSLPLLVEELLGNVRFRTPWKDLEGSIQQVAGAVRRHLESLGALEVVQRLEVIRAVFYQTTRAYLVGRIIGPGLCIPLVLALRNADNALRVDAVLMSGAEVSILFSVSRSYFHADLERVDEAVAFLRSILPRKPVSELFTLLGRAKQGKTERYREIVRHLESTEERFVHAAGDKGLVMVCFTLPSLEVVFKVIRDRFAFPKNVRREEVLAKYQLVYKHDRAGRLVDAQEFRRLRLARRLFAPELLAELLGETALTVHEDGAYLDFDHLYIERRLIPLNLYLRTSSPTGAERAVRDYGQCIRDLARTNIFPGDLLPKNFGVTRHGRVIFYDYDELCEVTDCRFRDLPRTSRLEEEMAAEPWFYVGENDVFPETFVSFMAFTEAQRATLLGAHGEIFTAAYWRQVQQRLVNGEVLEVLPYQGEAPAEGVDVPPERATRAQPGSASEPISS
jgi:isocitrate dehydrogenase kinase/phosphatase